jgi:6-phosphogluconolactonase
MSRGKLSIGTALSVMAVLVFALSGVGTAAAQQAAGAVYTLSNDASGNAVVVLDRAADGTLSPAGSVSTGGRGSGGGLGSQGALVLSDDGRWLIGVNAGSDDISVFAVGSSGLRLTDVQSSGGDNPISVTIRGRLVYVLNDGSDDVSGLRLTPGGKLKPINGAIIGLSGEGIAPAQVEFTPDGRHLVVTEKNTNLIDVYEVRASGRLSAPNVEASEGMTPFGFAFDPQGRLIVSEAFGGAAGASALSSYTVGADGSLGTISASVPDFQAAACWVVVTPDGRFAYTTNTGSNNVSGYEIGSDGSLTLFGGAPFTTGATPIDVDLAGGDFLYNLNAGSDSISAFTVGSDGSLSAIAGAAGLPAASVGLAAA